MIRDLGIEPPYGSGVRYGNLITVNQLDFGIWIFRCDCGNYLRRMRRSIEMHSRVANKRIRCVQCEYLYGTGVYSLAADTRKENLSRLAIGFKPKALPAKKAPYEIKEPTPAFAAYAVRSEPLIKSARGLVHTILRHDDTVPSSSMLYSTDAFRHSILRECDYSPDTRCLLDFLGLM